MLVWGTINVAIITQASFIFIRNSIFIDFTISEFTNFLTNIFFFVDIIMNIFIEFIMPPVTPRIEFYVASVGGLRPQTNATKSFILDVAMDFDRSL